MADSRGSGGRKKKAPVEVHYFPKRGGPGGGDRAQEGMKGARITLPDLNPDEPSPGETVEASASAVARPSGRSRRSSPRSASSERAGRGRRRRPPPGAREVDSTVRQKAQQLQELLARPDHAPIPAVSRTQIAEMSLFGHHLFERGQLDEARAVFEKIVGMGVEEAFPHTMLGTIYLASGDPDRALALFEAALSLDEADLAARVYRAEIRLNAGKVEEATEDLDLAIKLGIAEDPFVDRAKRLLERAQERARRPRR